MCSSHGFQPLDPFGPKGQEPSSFNVSIRSFLSPQLIGGFRVLIYQPKATTKYPFDLFDVLPLALLKKIWAALAFYNLEGRCEIFHWRYYSQWSCATFFLSSKWSTSHGSQWELPEWIQVNHAFHGTSQLSETETLTGYYTQCAIICPIVPQSWGWELWLFSTLDVDFQVWDHGTTKCAWTFGIVQVRASLQGQFSRNVRNPMLHLVFRAWFSKC